MFTGDGGQVDAGEVKLLGGTGTGLTRGGSTIGGTGFARLTAAKLGVSPVCCCDL